MKAWLCCHEFRTAFGKILRGGEQRPNNLDQISGLVKRNENLTEMSISSVFVLGRTFWCQKLRLDLLNSEQVSEKFSDVRNTIKN
jgi:hypothetical protein